MISCCVRVKSVKPSRTTSLGRKDGERRRGKYSRRMLPVERTRVPCFRLRPPPAVRLLQRVARRPEPPFRVEQAMLAQSLLIGGIDFGQFDVLVAQATCRTGAMELLRPDLQPFQFADEFAHQIHQSAGRGDRLEMLQPPPRRLLGDDLVNELAFHQSGHRTNGKPGGVEDRFRELFEGHDARAEAADKTPVEQA